MEEIITIDGKLYQLSYDQPINPEHVSYIINEIRSSEVEIRRSECKFCRTINNISGISIEDPIKIPIISLTPTCPAGSKSSGSTITLNAAPTGGIAPYTVTFYKKINTGAQTQITQVTGVPEGGPVIGPPTYIITDTDVTGATGDPGATPPLNAAKIRIIISILDSCPVASGGPSTCTELCDITLTCGTITCNAVIS